MYKNALSKLAETLTSQYEVMFEHRGNRGDSREKTVIQYLEKTNPSRYGFSKGEVFDKNEKNSGEVDIVIYDKLFSTVFTDGSDKILAPVESTFGIIEVKSNLTRSELKKSIAKLKKYNNLERDDVPENCAQISPDLAINGGPGIKFTKSDNQRINGIFAFKNNINKSTLIDLMKIENCIDYIIVPKEFVFIGRKRNNGFGFKHDGGEIDNFISLGETSVGIWITYLQQLLSNSRLISVSKKDILINLIQGTEIYLK